MALSEAELVAMQRQHAEVNRTIHKRYRLGDETVCEFCLTPWPCRSGEWANEVLGQDE